MTDEYFPKAKAMKAKSVTQILCGTECLTVKLTARREV